LPPLGQRAFRPNELHSAGAKSREIEIPSVSFAEKVLHLFRDML
jgi:hypothetical protein